MLKEVRNIRYLCCCGLDFFFSPVGIPKLQIVYISKVAIGTVISDSDVGTRTGVKKNVWYCSAFAPYHIHCSI